MKYEDACYIAASAKHINKTNSVVLPFSSKICLTFYNELYLYTQVSFPYSMSFKKELISSFLKNAANAKATSFDQAPDRKKRAQEVEKAYINCKDKFIAVKKTEIKKTTTTVVCLDL